ncbi:MAG: TIGR02757 family protein [Deltaproteobacteria bacterium]|nr:TIGR02757 family protein [Deltaproteobacteria bacterium]
MQRPDTILMARLDKLYGKFDNSFLDSDPICFVHGFKTKRDKEVAGLISSSLAYGQVSQIKKTLSKVFDACEWKPYEFAVNFKPNDVKAFGAMKHRFNDARDIACLFNFIGEMIRSHGSIENFFMVGFSEEQQNIKEALESFSLRTLALNSKGIYGGKKLPKKAGVRFFFPRPSDGSACKRLNLYLRWMIRKDDGVDFGLWKKIPTDKLIIPLDTHIARISGNLGLTKKKTPGWAMAEDITTHLKGFNKEDPVRYDFALSRLGILDKCPKKMNKVKCASCLIKDICVL